MKKFKWCIHWKFHWSFKNHIMNHDSDSESKSEFSKSCRRARRPFPMSSSSYFGLIFTIFRIYSFRSINITSFIFVTYRLICIISSNLCRLFRFPILMILKGEKPNDRALLQCRCKLKPIFTRYGTRGANIFHNFVFRSIWLLHCLTRAPIKSSHATANTFASGMSSIQKTLSKYLHNFVHALNLEPFLLSSNAPSYALAFLLEGESESLAIYCTNLALPCPVDKLSSQRFYERFNEKWVNCFILHDSYNFKFENLNKIDANAKFSIGNP